MEAKTCPEMSKRYSRCWSDWKTRRLSTMLKRRQGRGAAAATAAFFSFDGEGKGGSLRPGKWVFALRKPASNRSMIFFRPRTVGDRSGSVKGKGGNRALSAGFRRGLRRGG